MPQPSIDAVIFDSDGTLVDSETLGPSVLFDCLRERGVGDGFLDLRQVRGRNLDEYLAELQATCGIPLPADVLTDYRTRLHLVLREQLQPIRGAYDMVREVASRVPVAVASSGTYQKIDLALTVTGLREFFGDHLFSSHDVRIWKPDPGLFLHVARTLGVPPHRCAVVEDSRPGVTAGIAAGMHVYGFDPESVELGDISGIHRATDLATLAQALVSRLPAPRLQ